MSKVKGAKEEKWKHAIDPLTQGDLRVEEGEPQFYLCLALFQTQHRQRYNITHVSFHRFDDV